MSETLDISKVFTGFDRMLPVYPLDTEYTQPTLAEINACIELMQSTQEQSEPELTFYVSLKMHKRLYILTALASWSPRHAKPKLRKCVMRRIVKRRQVARAYEKKYTYAQ